MNVPVGGCCKQNTAFRRVRRGVKVAVGPGSGDCKAGYETSNCGELRVRWRELCALGEGAEHELAKVGVQTELG